MTNELSGKCFLVSGRVQGVGFRYATAEKARELDLTGHARNLADGRVEVLAYGGESSLRELQEWLGEGPPLAHVCEVIAEDVAEVAASAKFEIR